MSCPKCQKYTSRKRKLPLRALSLTMLPLHCNGGYNSDANNTNGTDEHDDDTNGGYDKDSKEDSENIADNVHHNNGEQGHLKVFLKH